MGEAIAELALVATAPKSSMVSGHDREGEAQMRAFMSLATSGLATAARGGRGIFTRPATVKPERPLELYEFEGCPFCRLVREVLTELDLDAMIFPCPKGGDRFRPRVVELGGKAQFPFLVDPNAGRLMYESADIIAHLFETYGRRPLPTAWRLHRLQVASSMLATLHRRRVGTRARPSTEPARPLELYGFESSPFVRPVREVLCELELPYLLHSVGRTRLLESVPPAIRDCIGMNPGIETDNRKEFLARSGRMMVPYLIDPNTGTAMFESDAICAYLNQTYATQADPTEV